MVDKSSSLRNRNNKKEKQSKGGKKNRQNAVAKEISDAKKRHSRRTNKTFSLLAGGAILAVIISVLVSHTTSNRQTNNIQLDFDERVLEPSSYREQSRLSTDFLRNFLDIYICKQIGAYCHPQLKGIPERRTHQYHETKSSSMPIQDGEIILRVPQKLLITELDALRDEEFIRPFLLGARHEFTGNALDPGAYLAVYLVRRYWLARRSIENEEEEELDKLYPYLKVLPTYDDLSTYHPLLWPDDLRESLLGVYRADGTHDQGSKRHKMKKTTSVQIIEGFRSMIHSEYTSFSNHYKKKHQTRNLVYNDNDKDSLYPSHFETIISMEEYFAMRINVLSRNFGILLSSSTSPLKQSQDNNIFQHGELQYYKDQAGLDIRDAIRSMVPILDMWDHHASSNTEWFYDHSIESFVAKASYNDKTANSLTGYDVFNSYGTHSDSYLFAKFGFVNGDGSEWTESSLAVFHQMADVGVGERHFIYNIASDSQFEYLATYLSFDYGYPQCIHHPSNTINQNTDDISDLSMEKLERTWLFKRMKLFHLQKFANIRKYWVIQLPPRDPDALPKKVSVDIGEKPIIPRFHGRTLTSSTINAHIKNVLFVCRLIALHEDDFDGKAYELLKTDETSSDSRSNKQVDSELLFLPKDSDDLEYRALVALERLCMIALSFQPKRIEQNISILSQEDDVKFRSNEWNAAHVRLGEMQTLDLILNYAHSGKIQMYKNIKEGSVNLEPRKKAARLKKLEIRNEVCPPDSRLWDNFSSILG